MTQRIRISVMFIASIGVLALGVGCGSEGEGSPDGADNASQASESAGSTDAGNAGQDSESATSADPVGTSSLSKGAYVRRAEFICGRAGQRIVAAISAERKKNEKDGKEENAGFEVPTSAAALLPALEKESDELHKLGAPAGDQDEVEAILTALQDGIDATAEGDISTLDDFGKGLVRFDELVVAYGLKRCVFGLG